LRARIGVCNCLFELGCFAFEVFVTWKEWIKAARTLEVVAPTAAAIHASAAFVLLASAELIAIAIREGILLRTVAMIALFSLITWLALITLEALSLLLALLSVACST
jgi:hypothetical protein